MCVNTASIGVFVVGDISKLMKENQQKQTILNEFLKDEVLIQFFLYTCKCFLYMLFMFYKVLYIQ